MSDGFVDTLPSPPTTLEPRPIAWFYFENGSWHSEGQPSSDSWWCGYGWVPISPVTPIPIPAVPDTLPELPNIVGWWYWTGSSWNSEPPLYSKWQDYILKTNRSVTSPDRLFGYDESSNYANGFVIYPTTTTLPTAPPVGLWSAENLMFDYPTTPPPTTPPPTTPPPTTPSGTTTTTCSPCLPPPETTSPTTPTIIIPPPNTLPPGSIVVIPTSVPPPSSPLTDIGVVLTTRNPDFFTTTIDPSPTTTTTSPIFTTTTTVINNIDPNCSRGCLYLNF